MYSYVHVSGLTRKIFIVSHSSPENSTSFRQVSWMGSSDVKLHLLQKGGQSFFETSGNFMDTLRTYDIYWESQLDG